MELIRCLVCGMEVGDYNAKCPYCSSDLNKDATHKETEPAKQESPRQQYSDRHATDRHIKL